MHIYKPRIGVQQKKDWGSWDAARQAHVTFLISSPPLLLTPVFKKQGKGPFIDIIFIISFINLSGVSEMRTDGRHGWCLADNLDFLVPGPSEERRGKRHASSTFIRLISSNIFPLLPPFYFGLFYTLFHWVFFFHSLFFFYHLLGLAPNRGHVKEANSRRMM